MPEPIEPEDTLPERVVSRDALELKAWKTVLYVFPEDLPAGCIHVVVGHRPIGELTISAVAVAYAVVVVPAIGDFPQPMEEVVDLEMRQYLATFIM